MRRRTERTQQVLYPPESYHIDYVIDLRSLGGKACHKWRDFIGMMKHCVFMHEALGKFGFWQEVVVPAFEPESTEPTPHSWHTVRGYGELPKGMINIYWRMQFSDEFEKALIRKCLTRNGGEKVKFLDLVRKKLAEQKEKRERKEEPVEGIIPVPDGRKHNVSVSTDSVKVIHWKRDGVKDSVPLNPHKGLVLKKRVRNGKVEYFYDVER